MSSGDPCHSMVTEPPGSSTDTSFSVKLFKIPATTDAQAPVPHARVIPHPRSQTLSSISFLVLILMTSIYVFFGQFWISIYNINQCVFCNRIYIRQFNIYYRAGIFFPFMPRIKFALIIFFFKFTF